MGNVVVEWDSDDCAMHARVRCGQTEVWVDRRKGFDRRWQEPELRWCSGNGSAQAARDAVMALTEATSIADEMKGEMAVYWVEIERGGVGRDMIRVLATSPEMAKKSAPANWECLGEPEVDEMIGVL